MTTYQATASKRLRGTADKSGTQAGDPVKAGEAMIEIALAANPPRQLVLGAWRARGAATDYDAA